MSAEVRRILHVDMDAFFVSVELISRPELRGHPVVVGGAGERGVIAAASYEARAYGVHSAMSSVKAKRMCPDLTFLSGDHGAYSDVSRRLMEIFRSHTPLVEPLSLDEAFLDVTGSRKLLGSTRQIADSIRAQVLDQEHLPCTVGVSAKKFISKLASGKAKPQASATGPIPGHGVLVVPPSQELAFLHPLPLRDLWGVGPKTRAKLDRLGIDTVGELAALPVAAVINCVGQASGQHLHDLANGIDTRPVVPDQELKSVSHEETFSTDIDDREQLECELVRMADAVGRRLSVGNHQGRTINIKVRYLDFTTLSRSITIDHSTDSGRTIAREAKQLLAKVEIKPGVRLLGVGVTNLGGDGSRQLRLGEEVDLWDDAERTVDEIRDRFGSGSIGPAVLAEDGHLRVKEKGQQQWGPSV